MDRSKLRHNFIVPGGPSDFVHGFTREYDLAISLNEAPVGVVPNSGITVFRLRVRSHDVRWCLLAGQQLARGMFGEFGDCWVEEVPGSLRDELHHELGRAFGGTRQVEVRG